MKGLLEKSSFFPGAGACPRELPTATKNVRSPEAAHVFCYHQDRRGTGPRPTSRQAWLGECRPVL